MDYVECVFFYVSKLGVWILCVDGMDCVVIEGCIWFGVCILLFGYGVVDVE